MSHPTPPHLADELKRDDGRLWPLIELLTRHDAPQLLHDVVRRLVELLEADEVALHAGRAPAVLIAAHGGQAMWSQHRLVDRRMADALASRHSSPSSRRAGNHRVRASASEPAGGEPQGEGERQQAGGRGTTA